MAQSAPPSLHAAQQQWRSDVFWGTLKAIGHKNPHTLGLLRSQKVYTFGREDNGLEAFTLDHKTISREHATITWHGEDNVVLHDDSVNGTWVNDKYHVHNGFYPLKDGDTVWFGGNLGTKYASPFGYLFNLYAESKPKVVSAMDRDYILGGVIGRGAFATVHMAFARATNSEKYAVKVISKRQWALQPAREEIIRRELAILNHLSHPNIVHYLETYDDADALRIRMEYVEGGDLMALISRTKGGLSEMMSRCITHNVCSAMSYLHHHRIAHRDIKPENVLICRGEPLLAKVADFGLAKCFDGDTGLITRCGSALHTAPEILRGTSYTEVVDSWSIGITVFQMLTGKLPFEASENNVDARIASIGSQLEEDDFSVNARLFMQGLLLVNHEARLSMHQALGHPWLTESGCNITRGYVAGMEQFDASTQATSSTKPLSMVSSAAAVFAWLSIAQQPSSEPTAENSTRSALANDSTSGSDSDKAVRPTKVRRNLQGRVTKIQAKRRTSPTTSGAGPIDRMEPTA